MIDSILIFEDETHNLLFPLTYTRPVYDLRCGILTLKEKIEKTFAGIPIAFHTRDYLAGFVKQNNPGIKVNGLNDDVKTCLLINGCVVADKKFKEQIDLESNDTIYVKGDKLIAALVSGENLSKVKSALNNAISTKLFDDVNKVEIDAQYVTYQWDFVNYNGSQIIADFDLLVDKKDEMIKGKIYDNVSMVNKENIFIDEDAKIKPGVVLDAEEGPIYIGKGAKIFPNAVIEGPCYIGDKSQIKVGAKIYENTSIGPVCKVGGEVEESIIHSYSNKQHDGFLGHAYLGCWVNLGADTNNSDLKNNYGNVKVIINDEQIDSGSMFVGLTMGDHSKAGINTMFNTGTVIGVSCNVYGPGFPDKYIPSFSWGGTDSITTYDINKGVEVAKRVMERRKVNFTDADAKVFHTVFDLTKEERLKRNMPA